MCNKIVHSSTVLTLLGGGSANITQLEQALRIAPHLVAADGGADFAIKCGKMPASVIGDMDSISSDAKTQIDPENFHHISEQDSTDFEKCLRSIEARAILALGFTGGRLDHELAACSALVRYPSQNCILVGKEDVCFLAPNVFSIDLPKGTRFSLFPMAQISGESTGLKYPIGGIEMSPATRGGTSNEVTGPVTLRFDTRHMLVLFPVCYLNAALEALLYET